MLRLKLAHHLCPGDSLVLSAAIRSLHLTYPGEYVVDVDCTARELYDGNPDVQRFQGHDIWGEVHYDSINRSDQEPHHFAEAMCRGVAKIIGKPVPLQTNRPVLILSDNEKDWSGVLKDIAPEPIPFGVISSGGKRDYTAKIFGNTIAQGVVDHFAGRIQFVQTGTGNELHTPLRGVINFIDRTSVRDLARVAHHASFAVGGVTLLMHVCAALAVPYVAMLGGREPRSWTTYPTQIDLSAHGCLDCCRDRACWKSRVVPLGDHTPNDRSLCVLPVAQAGGETIPRCHQLIGSAGIISAIDRLGL